MPLPVPDDDGAENLTPLVIIHGGTLTDALHLARTWGRLLVAFIPATKPTSHARNDKGSATRIYDQTAVDSLLDPEVAAVAEKRARKREEGGIVRSMGCEVRIDRGQHCVEEAEG